MEDMGFIDQPTKDYWQLVLRFYDGNHHSLAYYKSVHIDLPGIEGASKNSAVRSADGDVQAAEGAYPNISAWQAVDEGWYRNQVVSYLNSTRDDRFLSGMGIDIAMSIFDIHAVLGISQPTPIAIQALGAYQDAIFSDGSSMRFAWDPVNVTFSYVGHTAKDASGNTIPDDPNDVAAAAGGNRVYAYQDNAIGRMDSTNFWLRVSQWNIPNPPPSTPSVVVCTGAGKGQVCTRQQ